MLSKKGLNKKKETKKEENQSLALVAECIRIVEQKGFDSDALFHETKTEVAKLKKELEKGRITQLAGIDPIIVGGLLRNILTEKPLIGSEFYDSFRPISDKLSDIDEGTRLLRELVGNLGETKPILHHLLVLLKKISQNSEKNKLELQKLAAMFAPLIIKKKPVSTAVEPNEDPAIRAVVSFMIVHCEAVFGGEKEPVPIEIHPTHSVAEDEEESQEVIDESQDALIKKTFYVFGPEVYESFAKMLASARDRNVLIDVPQIVIMGQAEHGKTAFLEALLGHPYSALIPCLLYTSPSPRD
eukprot:TRINITY_DN8913_c0_g1_i1.p1 TRINITY_DN8913_c0_g1~~TRINITY_DN8913_c0_g1_i1.p1  ORF type:complete len:299 (+),score=95.57 TRINITY_DN8913_c0_g1_i1:99-995(+)